MDSYIKLKEYTKETPTTINIKWDVSDDLKSVHEDNSLLLNFEEEVPLNSFIAHYIFLSAILPIYALETQSIITVHLKYNYNELYQKLIEYHSLKNCVIKYENLKTHDEINLSNTYENVNNNTFGIFYGGGKDSLLSAALHQYIYPKDSNIILLRLIFGTSNELVAKRNIFKASVKDLIDSGFSLKTCESDFHSKVRDSATAKRCNFGLFFAFFAPLLFKYNFKQLSFGVDGTEYYYPKSDGIVPYLRVRPEKIVKVIEAFNNTSNTKTKIKNFNFAIPPGLAFKIILKKFPHYMNSLYMCERAISKWCIKCRKCFTYVLYSIAYKNEKPDFSFSYFFENSIYVKELIKEIKHGNINIPKSKYIYINKLCYHKHQLATFDVINSIDFNYARSVIYSKKYPNAWKNFLEIVTPFLGLDSKNNNSFWLAAYNYENLICNNDLENSARDIIISIIKEVDGSITEAKNIEGLNRFGETKYIFS